MFFQYSSQLLKTQFGDVNVSLGLREKVRFPQGGSPRKLARSTTGKRVASQPPRTLHTASNPGYLEIESFANPPNT